MQELSSYGDLRSDVNVAIEARNLTKRYGKFTAVNGLNLKVFKGEFFGLLGPNGAGKTTTVRMLTGLLTPTEGEALIMGVNIMERPLDVKRLMGVVPEVSNIYVEMTAWENLLFIAELYDVPRDAAVERAKELLEVFGLYERRHDKAATFSKGMRRRLAIAAALIHNPEIIFLDEPTSGLDVQSTRIIRNVLRKLNKEGVTIFMTTHFIDEADNLCGRVGIINRGHLVALDKPERLKQTIGGELSIEVSISPIPSLEDLKVVGGDVVRSGDKFRIYTRDPSATLSKLTGLADLKGWKIISVRTLTPSLEDVFVKLTGLTAVDVERLELVRPSGRRRRR
ncbi:MAG: Daunorubicin/doxorubicin resistance ATP-binding protein DrrA [Candidatus Bathyarchaeota archaeon B24]|nr:MAG: Daunorubicin/doxorubicin resistance ATP-binding protein DrrA [Candidatus Bathyarchaeota archaeon B24]RLI26519.1 MAG: ATP-binding protein [Candidatus Bathyarchaeota archaeon]